MAWREKTAWITLVAMLVAYGGYFTLIGRSALPVTSMLGLFGAVTVVQVIAVIVVTSVWAVSSGQESRAKADERDRAIARRGAGVAYYVLMAGVIAVGLMMPFRDAGWLITNAGLFALVVAETARQVIVVISYRRGWHG